MTSLYIYSIVKIKVICINVDEVLQSVTALVSKVFLLFSLFVSSITSSVPQIKTYLLHYSPGQIDYIDCCSSLMAHWKIAKTKRQVTVHARTNHHDLLQANVSTCCLFFSLHD